MAELEVTAENKVVLSGIGALTVEALAQAATALTERGVPDSAELSANQSMSGQRWSIIAKWEPVIPPPWTVPLPPPCLKDPEPEPELCAECGRAIRPGRPSGWVHVTTPAFKHVATQA